MLRVDDSDLMEYLGKVFQTFSKDGNRARAKARIAAKRNGLVRSQSAYSWREKMEISKKVKKLDRILKIL